MRWTPGGVSRDIEDRRGQRSGGLGGFRMRGGGGKGLGLGGILILLVLSLIFKQDFLSVFSGGMPVDVGTSAESSEPVQQSPQEQKAVEFVSFVLDDAQDTWERLFAQSGSQYPRAKLVLFRNAVDSACGFAQSASGPFYCPGDQKVYLDLAFFDELRQKFGASGEFAVAYVIAHEIGHHIQRVTGIESKVRRLQQNDPRSANRLSVALELQADCFAGVWGHSTGQRDLLENGDVEDGLRAAAAIGDDRIQRMAGRTVSPESWTHGSSAQRVEWLRRGLSSGDIKACQTLQ